MWLIGVQVATASLEGLHNFIGNPKLKPKQIQDFLKNHNFNSVVQVSSKTLRSRDMDLVIIYGISSLFLQYIRVIEYMIHLKADSQCNGDKKGQNEQCFCSSAWRFVNQNDVFISVIKVVNKIVFEEILCICRTQRITKLVHL